MFNFHALIYLDLLYHLRFNVHGQWIVSECLKLGRMCDGKITLATESCNDLLRCVHLSNHLGYDVDGDGEDDCAVVLRRYAVQRLQVPQLERQ